MPDIRYSQRCLNCHRKNGKRHSQKAYTFKCKYCGFVNPGPGLKPALEKVFNPPPEPTASNGRGRPPQLAKSAPAAATKTVIKVVKGSAPAKPKTPAPAKPTVLPPVTEPSFWERAQRAIYG